MKLLNFPIIKLTIYLIIGILIGYYCNISIYFTLFILGLLILILTVVFLIAKKQFAKTIWFGLFAFLIMVFIGVLTVNFHNQKNYSNHYSNFITKNDSIKTITFRIREVLKPGNYYDKYIIDILKEDSIQVSGKSILNVQKDTLKNVLHVDDIFITNAIFKEVIPPLNPSQFNYKSYLEKQYICHQLFIKNDALFKVKTNQQTLFGIANNIREHINLKLKSYKFKPDELAIINAILLGQRQNISDDVYSNYTNAGAIHILAISGLHIGIILMILSSTFKPIERLRYGAFIKALLLVVILWGFAIIAGLSASVTRAVTMFSIVAIGFNLKRPANIYNTLAISIFILLLFKPLFLFDVGFQLSYMAVFGIVTIDPYLTKLWKPKYYIPKKAWEVIRITFSAQLGILPISLYYFHQFPGLFFLSNLLIIPFLGFILGFGIVVIVLAILNILPDFLADLFGSTISLMNTVIEWVAQQDTFLFKNISFNILFVIASYLLIIALVRFFTKRNYKNLVFLFLAIIIGQSIFIYSKFESPKNQFLVFHKRRYTLLGNKFGNKICIANNFDDATEKKDKIITDYTIENQIKSLQKDSLQSVYILGNKKLLVIDSLGVYNVKSFKPDFILLRNSPKINLNRILDSLHPLLVVADGSNYKTYSERWKSTCKKTKIPFHLTSEKGVFIIDY
ncbi:ComEC/Rec2 family competence protein [Gaetbulibacter sp. M235]|uniref:ComEC/Rec2 family competence protein n=1 Tax=Gaetbulibacter sp. M235 TaxID=3126510 RepID=UPI00374EDA20